LSFFRKLVSDTATYGISSILARVINYFFTLLFASFFFPEEYGIYVKLSTITAFMLVLLTHGMETAFFRFYNQDAYRQHAYATAGKSVAGIAVVFLVVALLLLQPISGWLHYEQFPHFVAWFAWIIFFDVLTALPFAYLRANGKAIKFAIIKLTNVLLFVGLVTVFLIICPRIMSNTTHLLYDYVSSWYDASLGIGWVFIANLIASAVTLMMLVGEWRFARHGFDKEIYRRMLRYAFPVLMVGLAGMTNEMFSRLMLESLLPGTPEENRAQLGIFGYSYKLAMLMALFTQAYRFAAEPLFFKMAEDKDAKNIYTITLKYFLIASCGVFLLIGLNLPLIQHILGQYIAVKPEYFEGLKVVPVLLMASIFFGLYFNLSTWYKVTDKTQIGTYIAVFGAVITVVFNYLLIPEYGYMGAAWVTLLCYVSMVVLSWWLGQVYYPMQYDYKGIFLYLGLTWAFYMAKVKLSAFAALSLGSEVVLAVVLTGVFIGIAFWREQKLRHQPAIK
jgi:O-antigen/teichoic acid export membrane protein